MDSWLLGIRENWMPQLARIRLIVADGASQHARLKLNDCGVAGKVCTGIPIGALALVLLFGDVKLSEERGTQCVATPLNCTAHGAAGQALLRACTLEASVHIDRSLSRNIEWNMKRVHDGIQGIIGAPAIPWRDFDLSTPRGCICGRGQQWTVFVNQSGTEECIQS
jgi:hypothetical protein